MPSLADAEAPRLDIEERFDRSPTRMMQATGASWRLPLVADLCVRAMTAMERPPGIDLFHKAATPWVAGAVLFGQAKGLAHRMPKQDDETRFQRSELVTLSGTQGVCPWLV